MKAKLQGMLKESMKAREQVKVDTIRVILSAFQYEEMQKGTDSLTDEQSLAVLKSELKKRREELDYAEQAKREDLKAKLAIEISLLENFLPSQLSAEQIEKIIAALKAKDPSTNVGNAMKVLKESYAGQYDGKTASEVAKRVLG